MSVLLAIGKGIWKSDLVGHYESGHHIVSNYCYLRKGGVIVSLMELW